MFAIGMNYEVVKGKEPVFEKMFAKLADAMRGLDGHDDSDLYRNVNEPQRYLILSKWNDEAAFDEFMASDTFANVAMDDTEKVLAGHPRQEVLVVCD